MSQDFGRDQNWSHPRPDGNEGSEHSLNREEILQDAKTDDTVISKIRRLPDELANNDVLKPLWMWLAPTFTFLFLVVWHELCGPAANGMTRYWAKIIAPLTLGTQAINFVTAWPFLGQSLGIGPGLLIVLAIYLLANLTQKLACHRPRPGNQLGVLGLIASLIIGGVSTAAAPLANVQGNFGPDLSNQYAYTVFEKYAFAEQQSALEAVTAMEPQVREAKRECARLKAEIQSNKEKNLPYDNLALEAEGNWVEDYQTDKRWEGTPVENRPKCPQSRALERQFNVDKEKAENALRFARSDLKTIYGDNHLEALKQEHPHLYEMYFDEAGHIRSRQQKLAEAIRFMFASNAGVKVMISVPTLLSVLASALLFLSTYFYISNPAVQRSWNSRAALNQRNRIRRTFDGGNGHG